MEPHSNLLTNFFESAFRPPGYQLPVHTITPFDKMPTLTPFDEGPTLSPSYEKPKTTFNGRPILGPYHKWPNMRPRSEMPTIRPFNRTPIMTPSDASSSTVPLDGWPHWRPIDRFDLYSKPPDIQNRPPSNASAESESVLVFNLKNLLWVALGGFGAMVVIALLMKLGDPRGRVRRHLSNVRPTPNGLHSDSNSDLGSLLRLSNSDASSDPGPLHLDAPPPYSRCARAPAPRAPRDKRAREEPPPPYCACFISHTNTTDIEPQVHIRRQIGLDEPTHTSIDIDNGSTAQPLLMTLKTPLQE